MFSKSTAVYNEEVGELSFSILSTYFTHMDRKHGIIHTYRTNNEDMMYDQYCKAHPHKRYSQPVES